MNDTIDSSYDLELLQLIEKDPDVSQANLASELGVAIGTINWYLKRLVAKGYVKVKRAQRKKLKYIITPEGIALRTRLTMEYIRNSFTLYRQTREKTLALIDDLKQKNIKAVRIHGDGDIAEVCRLTCVEQSISVVNQAGVPSIIINGLDFSINWEQEVLGTSI